MLSVPWMLQLAVSLSVGPEPRSRRSNATIYYRYQARLWSIKAPITRRWEVVRHRHCWTSTRAIACPRVFEGRGELSLWRDRVLLAAAQSCFRQRPAQPSGRATAASASSIRWRCVCCTVCAVLVHLTCCPAASHRSHANSAHSSSSDRYANSCMTKQGSSRRAESLPKDCP